MPTIDEMLENPTFTIPADVADDIAPSGQTDSQPLRCQYDGCTNTVTKPSRGRTPKFCDEHKQAAKSPVGTRNSKWARGDEVEKILVTYLNMIGTGISLINPADGMVIASGSDAVAHELVELGRVDRKFRVVLERLATPGKYGPLFGACLPIIIGIMANHHLLPQFVIPGMGEGE